MKIDYPVANSYFPKRSSIVGEEEMEDFNNVMAEAFVFGPIGLLARDSSIEKCLSELSQTISEDGDRTGFSIAVTDDKIVKPFKLYFLL